jgi:hypothetical protein
MSIERLIELSRMQLTDEQWVELQRKARERFEQMDKEYIERFRCRECGADIVNYSHSFSCSRRGSGF